MWAYAKPNYDVPLTTPLVSNRQGAGRSEWISTKLGDSLS